MNRRTTTAMLVVPVCALTAANAAGQEQITNGSFEFPAIMPGGFRTVGVGDPFILGWEVTRGSVDILAEPRWAAADGRQMVDVVGTPGPGGIRQRIKTIRGELYTIEFSLSSNDECPGSKEVIFRWGSEERRLTGGSQGDWRPFVFVFEGNAGATCIQFLSDSPERCGGIVDAVSVQGPDGTCEGDIDGDGELTLFDFLEFSNLFDAGDLKADFDCDGMLTLFDFLEFSNAFDAGGC